MYADEHGGRLFPNALYNSVIAPDTPSSSPDWSLLFAFHPYSDDYYKMLLCPAAVKVDEGTQRPVHEADPSLYGDTFRPYQAVKLWRWRRWRRGDTFLASYGVNGWLVDYPLNYRRAREPFPYRTFYWEGAASKHASQVAVFFDCRYMGVRPVDGLAMPPEWEGQPAQWGDLSLVVMNRHSGGINNLFLAWSVRKVGVKEPWALKWHKEYNKAGPWTKRGGARPEDWPPWMRRFRDY